MNIFEDTYKFYIEDLPEPEPGPSILYIYGEESYLAKTMLGFLEQLGYDVIQLNAKDNKLPTIKTPILTTVIFLDEMTISNVSLLVFIKDKLYEYDRKLFLIGGEEEIKKAKNYLPEEILAKTYRRPIDFHVIIEDIKDYLDGKTELAQRKKILCIDDDPVMLRNLKTMLGGKYQVTIATSCSSALRTLSGGNIPDLILLDFIMPVCDGKQTLAMIRSDPELASIPVMFLTGNQSRDAAIEVMRLGIQGYILKTNPKDEILAEIERVLQKV